MSIITRIMYWTQILKLLDKEFNITVNNILRALMGKKDRKYVEQMDSVNWETELLRKN